MKKVVKFLFCSLLIVVAISATVSAQELISKSPDKAKLYFNEPKDGQTVPLTFSVKFGLAGMGVAPAGVNVENTGHHHILVDLDKHPDMTKPLMMTDTIRHFGGGQTETELTLPAGKHTLQLLLGNYLHIPHDKPVLSEKITITVK